MLWRGLTCGHADVDEGTRSRLHAFASGSKVSFTSVRSKPTFAVYSPLRQSDVIHQIRGLEDQGSWTVSRCDAKRTQLFGPLWHL
jgi:hypothetical protein